MKLEKRVVTVRETAQGWESSIGTFPTAAECERAIKKQDAARATEGIPNITVIEWYPTSRVGRMVVRAIAQ